MTRRTRRSQPSTYHVFRYVLLCIGALLLLVIGRNIGPIIVGAAMLAGGYGLGRWHASARRAGTQGTQARPVGQDRPRSGLVSDDARARRNGWLAPTHRAVTLALSPECASGECALCSGCEHGCGHDPKAIVARNERAYDSASDIPPF